MEQNLSRRNALRAILPAVIGTAAMTSAKAENQPHMQRAMAALRTAESNLDSATPDKGGHRVAALKLVREAMQHVDKGMGFDDRNNRDRRR